MEKRRPESAIPQLRALFEAGAVVGMGDGELLDRFASRRDEAAFAALVARHGPMILGLCRQWLRDPHDAEDAFQAVFLVLARKAGTIRDPELLGNWLYGVARRTAEKARGRIARRRSREGREATMDDREVAAEPDDPGRLADDGERSEVLHQELGRLPAKFRLPIVLCHLEGLTHEEAARRLRVPVGTIRSRLSRGRDRLRDRLGRRGLAIPAVAVAAALEGGTASARMVPSLIDRTARAAVQVGAGRTATGVASAAAVELANEVTRSLLMTKMKTMAAALLSLGAVAGAGAITAGAWFGGAPREAVPRVALERKVEDEKPAEVPKEGKMMMTASGRVLEPDGKPATGARVVILARPRAVGRVAELGNDNETLGRVDSDGEGRFRLEVPRTSSSKHMDVKLLASADGFGMAWVDLSADAPAFETDIKLLPEQVIRGRLVDLQGQPAGGVEVGVNGIQRPNGFGNAPGIWDANPPEGLAPWPRPSTTDADGRFVIKGVGRGVSASLSIRDPRFARQSIFVQTDDQGGPKEVSQSLEPAKLIEGRVTYADTGKPVPHALVHATVSQDEFGSMFTTPFHADAEGRFRMNPTPGQYFRVSAYAPAGEPYLIPQVEFAWTKGAARREINIELPRGVLIRGTVAEAGTGRAVPDASVQYLPIRPPSSPEVISGWQAIVPSGPDGRFAIAVLPGKGHLLIHGPSRDYVNVSAGSQQLYNGKSGGTRNYAHAILPYEAKAGPDPLTLDATLKPGVTLKGRVIDPDGKPVLEAEIITRLSIWPLSISWRGDFTIPVRDGAFELHGLDPDSTVPCYFLDAKNQLGATLEASAKLAAAPLTVRLQPCGAAKARFVDPEGQPVKGRGLSNFSIVATPGPSEMSQAPADRDALAADEELMANVDRLHYWHATGSDAEGRVTFPVLIPGALYRLVDDSQRNVQDVGVPVRRDFTVKPGETLDLGDILYVKPKAQ